VRDDFSHRFRLLRRYLRPAGAIAQKAIGPTDPIQWRTFVGFAASM
jgi:hypothetical protein